MTRITREKLKKGKIAKKQEMEAKLTGGAEPQPQELPMVS
jgi:hypothetical protein